MPQCQQGRSQDCAKVVGGQKHEVAQEAGKTGGLPAEVCQTAKMSATRKKVKNR